MDGVLGMLMSALVEIAFEVFNSRDEAQEKKEQRKMKQQAALLAGAPAQERPEDKQGPPREGARPKVRPLGLQHQNKRVTPLWGPVSAPTVNRKKNVLTELEK